jgi:transposase-like protein
MEIRFCPWKACILHDPALAAQEDRWYDPCGSHMTKVVGRVPRYRCRFCRRTFSDRSFSIDYYTKKSIPYNEIFQRLPASSSLSAMGRVLGASVESIQNRIDRLARSALALHEELSASFPLREDLAADGFESFDVSQYFPNHINLLVGTSSQHLYGFTHTTIRRKGRMTERQKDRRRAIETVFKAPVRGIRDSFSSLLEIAARRWDRSALPRLRLFTDEHPAYPPAVARVKPLAKAQADGSFKHTAISSLCPRTIDNPLFSVNYYDRELRKDMAAHRRETACHCRNVANGLSRLAVYMLWHNAVKPWRVKTTVPEPPHALMAGADGEVLERGLGRLFWERRFISHLRLWPEQLRVWFKQAPTPLKRRPDYVPAYAFG